MLVGVGGAVGGEAADDTGDLRQDVLKDDGDAKAHHKAHTEGLDDTLRGHNIEQAAAVPPTMMPKLPSSAPANQNATGAKPTKKPMDSNMGEL